jgi:FdrA protein
MSTVRHEIRPGAYADSIVLMHLQSSLAALPGVEDAGVVMGTPANLELLASNNLLTPEVEGAAADDLVLVVRASSEAAADEALSRVDELLVSRGGGADSEFRPHSLRSAVKLLPQAGWVLVSVPGRYAAAVADEALERGKHVFLYSDNVPLEDEVALKRKGSDAGLLVMGPDCGTAIVGGFGLGFANRVRRGSIGLVGASGTGLQAITSAIHAAGAGVSHAIGTGGRDLSPEVGGITALAGLELLHRDEATRVIVLISKPPAPEVAARLLEAARSTGKPVVVQFIGHPVPAASDGGVAYSTGMSETARLAVSLLGEGPAPARVGPPSEVEARAGYLRGLFAGGTLALEAQQVLAGLEPLHSNVPILGSLPATDLGTSRAHTILDLGADEFTVGRLHPMMDQDLRLRRLRQEAADPEVGVILLDVVLGEGSHPDPARDLAPAIAGLETGAEVVVVMVGTDQDPQGLDDQRVRLEGAGARVFVDVSEGFAYTAARLGLPAPAAVSSEGTPARTGTEGAPATAPDTLAAPFAALNVGLDSFYESLVEQGAEAIQLDWRPPAGGNERLMALLERMR